MEAFNSEFSKDDLQPANWNEMYILTRYWRSDLEFYLEDLSFLTKLVKKYSIWVKSNETSEEVRKMSAELHNIIQHGKELKETLEKHQSKIAHVIDQTSQDSEKAILEEHGALEKEMAEFVKNFRANRRNVFKVSEKVLDSENLSI